MSTTATPTVAVNECDDVGEVFLDRYLIEKQLGEGSYGKVKRATDMETGKQVALKVIHKSTIKKPEHITRIKREVRIMRLLNHPNIVKLYDVAETEKDIILSMEYVEGGELFDFIVSHNKLSEKVSRKIFRQIISAVDYCHRSSVIHRDLKPENLLLDSKRNIKIIDFGFVNLYDPEDVLNTFCGSPFYASPEMILGKKYVGPEVDIWSMGVILYALLTGQLPFRDVNTKDLYKKITTSNFTIPDYVSEDAADLIKKMLLVESEKRATLEDIRAHVWVNKTFESPPDAMIPHRKPLEEPLESAFIEMMRLYGYDTATARSAILASPDKGPAFSLYWLLKEQEEATKLMLARSRHSTEDFEDKDGFGSHLEVKVKSSIRRKKSINGAMRPDGPMQARSVDYSYPPVDPSQSLSVTTTTYQFNSMGRPARPASASEATDAVISLSRPVHPDRRPPSFGPHDVSVGSEESSETSVNEPPAVRRRRSVSAVSTHYTPTNFRSSRRPSLPHDGETFDSLTRPSASETNTRARAASTPATPPPQAWTASNAVSSESFDRRRRTSAAKVKRSDTQTSGSSKKSLDDKGQQSGLIPESESMVQENQPVVLQVPDAVAAAAAPPKKRRMSLGAAISNAFSKMKPMSTHRKSSITTTPEILPRISKSIYTADTTSSKDVKSIVAELNRVFEANKINVTWTAYKVKCVAPNTVFEIEICTVSGTLMYGLELRRKKGSISMYQEVCRTLISQWKL